MEIRKAALTAVIDVDHSTKWAQAIQFPSRPSEVSLFLPGNQVFFWKKQKTQLKGRRARMPTRWYGPAIVIGHEFNVKNKMDSYWVSYGGHCVLVAGQHLRHAELDELIAQEDFIKQLKEAMSKAARPNFQYTDMRGDALIDPVDSGNLSLLSSTAPRPTDKAGYVPPPNVEPSSPFRSSTVPDYLSRQPYHLPEQPEAIRPGMLHGRTSRIGFPPSRTLSEPDQEMMNSSQGEFPAEDSITGSPEGERGEAPPTPPRPTPGDLDEAQMMLDEARIRPVHGDGDDGSVFYLRQKNLELLVDQETQECLMLRWKTLKKDQRKGKELDAKYFNEAERRKFFVSDSSESQSFLDTGAAVVISPRESLNIPEKRVFRVPVRYVRTNEDKSGEDENLIAKSRLVVPGHVDTDGEVPVEDGGFRTDAPTASQLDFHMLCSLASRRNWKLTSFDVKTAFLSRENTDREIYCRLPREGLPLVAPRSLIKLVKGAYGLREAPRLWYLRIRKLILQAGSEELRTSKGSFVLRDRQGKDSTTVGMLVSHVDDACYAGSGKVYDEAVQKLRKSLNIGKIEVGEFEFLGRMVKQLGDETIEIHQHPFVEKIERVKMTKDRIQSPKSKLIAKNYMTTDLW